MILHGTLLNPVGTPYANASVRLVAVSTSSQVLQSVYSTFKTSGSGAYSFDCPVGRYRVQVSGLLGVRDIGIIAVNSTTTFDNINDLLMLESTTVPRDPLLDQIMAVAGEAADSAQAAADSAASITSYNLKTWAYGNIFQLVSAARDANSAIISANIIWPDNVTGVFTTDIASSEFPGAIDAWHATYAGSPAKLITQPAVTRDASGAVTAQPAITIV